MGVRRCSNLRAGSNGVARVPVILALLLLPGCLGAQAPDPVSAPQVGAEDAHFPKGWALRDCFGFDTSADYVLAMGPGEVPPGWDFEPLAAGRYFTYAAFTLLHCESVRIGQLERNNVSWLFEAHSKFSPPEGCEPDFFGYMSVLHRILVSDPDITALLATTGLPAALGNFAVSNETSGMLRTWRWSATGGPESSLAMSPQFPQGGSITTNERMAWWNGSALFLLDMEWTMGSTHLHMATGYVAPDMLVHQGHEDRYDEGADIDVDAAASGRLRRYNDPECLS